MKIKQILMLPLCAFLIVSCGSATKELYKGNEYNNSDFMLNYYTKWNSIDSLNVSSSKTYDASPFVKYSDPLFKNEGEKPLVGLRGGDQYNNGVLLSWNSDNPIADYGIGFGPTKNLSSISDSFSYGVLSKLYDGRVRCDGYYTKSRVQLDKSGYATYFPKELINYKYFGMAIRGGTDCSRSFKDHYPLVDFSLKFYQPVSDGTYHAIEVMMNDVEVITNAGGRTYFVNFYFDNVFGSGWEHVLKGVTAMSLTYSLKSSYYSDLVDDMNNETNKHFAIMLYEIMLPDSSWR